MQGCWLGHEDFLLPVSRTLELGGPVYCRALDGARGARHSATANFGIVERTRRLIRGRTEFE